MKQAIKSVLLAISLLVAGVVSHAQVTTSSMSGKVTDKQGPLAGATVVAVHQPTGSQFYSVTDTKGLYRIPNMTAGGPYTVTVSCLGYADKVYTGVNLALSDNMLLNANLSEESMQLDAVTVSAESGSSNMRSDRAGAMTSLSSKQIMSLPSISRSMNDILKQTPQAYVSGTKTYIGGGSYRDSYVTVDGAAFNNAFGIGSNLPAGGSPISLEALDQVAISITPYDVRQSGFTGGGINATTKSGTNQYHATAYWYFRNQDMQGYNVNGVELSKTDNHYNMGGFTVGGPIIKDKLFFFINAEWDRSVSPGPTRKLSDRTLDADGKIINVEGGNVFSNGSNGVARPSALVLDLIQSQLRSKYGYDPGMYLGYNTETPSFKFLGRIDWNISRDHRLNIRYSLVNSGYASAPSTSTTGFANTGYTSQNRTSMYALYFQNARYYQDQNHSSVAAELNSRFLDGTLGNALRFTWSHQYEPRHTDGGFFPFVDVAVGGNTYTSFGYEPFSYGNLRDVTTLVATDELTYSLGSHSLLAGVQFESDVTKNGFQRMGAGAFVYEFDDEQELYDALKAGTWLDTPSQFAITHGNNSTFAQEYPHFNFYQFALYLQDDWSVSDRFKLNAGVRLEVPIYPSLDFNRNQRVEQTTFAPTLSYPDGKYNTVDMPKSRLTASPRVGFNWDILGNRKLVARGGTGIFIGRIPFVWIVAQSGDAGVLQTTVTRSVAAGQTVPTISGSRDALLSQVYPEGFSPEASGLNLTSITLMDKDLTSPMSWKSSLALDAELPGGFVASVEGTFKKDINPVTVRNIGLKNPTRLTETQDIVARPYYANGSYDSQITAAYLLYNVTNPKLWGWYYSVTAKLEKKPWHGLSGSVSYTHAASRVINDGVGDQLYSVWNGLSGIGGANEPELGWASYVMPHRVIANVSYSIDYLKWAGSSVTLTYYGGPVGRYTPSYYASSSILNTGANAYDPMDIPTYEDIYGNDGWKFEDYKPFTGSGYTDAQKAIVYRAEDQKRDFWNYIQQDPYLRSHTGQVAERYALVGPWTHHFDLQFKQNFYFFTGSYKHTIQLGLDIQNIGNLLNPAWGNEWSARQSAKPLVLTNAKEVYTEGAKPVFNFRADGSDKLYETFNRYTGFDSTWQMIFSARYIF